MALPKYDKSKRKSNTFRSSLTEITGVGEKRAVLLIKHFGTIANIKEAEIEELEKTPFLNKAVAQNIYSYFHKEDDYDG